MTADPARFTEADLAPAPSDTRRVVLERLAVVVAVLAGGVVVGGLVALGACAAPFVFRLTPAPFSGDAMGSAFARFDQIAIGAGVAMLAAEVLRTWLDRRDRRAVAPRVRRLSAVLMAGCAAYIGLALTPAINGLHRAGVQRGVGAEGEELDRIHKRAESFGKAEVVLAIVAVALHVATVRGRGAHDDEDDEEAVAPLAPGGEG